MPGGADAPVRVIVAGGGIVGLSAAWAVARHGHAVTLVDRSTVPNDRAASMDTHRFIRHAYGRARGYTRMVDDAYRALDVLWADLGRACVVPTGTLIAADAPGADELDGTVEVFREQGRAFERLDGSALARRWPVFTGRGVADALHVPTGGVFQPDTMLRAMAAWLREAGATIREHAPVAAIEPEGPALHLASGERLTADAVVVAVGAWTAALLPDLADAARPSRQICAYAAPPASSRAAWARTPLYMQVGRAIGLNIAPPVAGRPIKIGDHGFTFAGDPDEPREAGPAAAEAMFRAAADTLADFDGYRLLHGRRCFYTVAPEERFVAERRGAAWLMTGFSGHGFKFGPLLGLRLAEAIDGRRSAEALVRWAAGHDDHGEL